MPDAHVQIQVGEANVAQLAAWNCLWSLLLGDGRISPPVVQVVDDVQNVMDDKAADT